MKLLHFFPKDKDPGTGEPASCDQARMFLLLHRHWSQLSVSFLSPCYCVCGLTHEFMGNKALNTGSCVAQYERQRLQNTLTFIYFL